MPTYSRRQAIAGLAAGAAAMRLGRAARRPPNMVFILVDDLRWDAFSHLGHPFLRTPNIDRLAREGVRFANAFVNISLCSPSRACFISGCEPQRTGVLRNDANDIDDRLPTFPRLLQAAGWQTAWVGKWHQENRADPRPGFDYWLSFRGQGRYLDPDLNENGRDFVRDGYMTDLLTDYAVDWLLRAHDRPFCLTLSHKAVHGPFTPAARHQGVLDGVQMAEPVSWSDDCADKPDYVRAMISRGNNREQWAASRDEPIPERIPAPRWDPTARGRLGYYESLLAVDDSVGKVLDTLEGLGLLDQTMLVFTSDNGYFHGEHRRGDKRLAYEEGIRIPLLIRYPPLAAAGRVIEPLALSIDLCPTFLELCGQPVPEGVLGRSLLPLLREPGRPAGWRDEFLYQYFQEGWLPGIPDLQAVRSESHKYIRSPQHPGQVELYDLTADPHELDNLAGQPALAGLEAGLAARLDELVAAAEATALPPKPVVPELLLDWDLTRPDERLARLPVGELAGRAARRFDGGATVTLERGDSPAVQGRPFWAEVEVVAEAPDAVIVSQGGQSQGWSLELRAGRPLFRVTSGEVRYGVEGPAPVAGRWVTLAGVLDRQGAMHLLVDGREVAAEPGAQPLGGLPSEGLTLGADAGTRVGLGEAKPFVGGLARLRVGIGESPD